MREALPHQLTAIDKLARLKVGALFPEPGTGKTFIAHQLIESVQSVDGIVWFGPFQTIHHPQYELTIKHEIDKCGGFSRPVHYFGIETIQASDRAFLQVINLLESGNYFVVVDESAKIKNWSARRTSRFLEIGRRAQYKLILNGVPVSRNLLDIHSQMEFLSPHILNMSATQFENTFCETTTIKKRFGSSRWLTKKFVSGFANVDYLYSLIQPYIFECDLQLEVGRQWVDYNFRLNENEEAEYTRIKTTYLDDEKLMMMNNNIFMELTSKLQHMYSNSEEKFDLLGNYIKAHGVENVCVFRRFLAAQNQLQKRFPGLKVFSIQSQSLGLNLQQFNHLVIWDKTWDYLLIKQLIHRIYRTGQQRTCYFVNLNANTGLDGLILQNNETKGALLQYFKKHGYEILKQII